MSEGVAQRETRFWFILYVYTLTRTFTLRTTFEDDIRNGIGEESGVRGRRSEERRYKGKGGIKEARAGLKVAATE